ncbi:MAG: hypothetical protein IPP37_15515 [Saprospiraceae bacterium]|nr:hypothetical protein [Saprospiraceae bacterium]
MKYRIVALFLLVAHMASTQSIGVRAGWNFNTFSGPLETNESYAYTNGIHFGINYGYKLSSTFMVRAELCTTKQEPNKNLMAPVITSSTPLKKRCMKKAGGCLTWK